MKKKLSELRQLSAKFRKAIDLSSETVRDSKLPADELQRELLDMSYSRSDVLDIEAAASWFHIKVSNGELLHKGTSTSCRLKRKAAKRLGINIGDEHEVLAKINDRRLRSARHKDLLWGREKYYGDDIPPSLEELRYTLMSSIKVPSIRCCYSDEELSINTRLSVWAFGKVQKDSFRAYAYHSTGHGRAYKKMFGNMRGFNSKRQTYHHGWSHTAVRGRLNMTYGSMYYRDGDTEHNLSSNTISLASWAIATRHEAVIAQANNAYHVKGCDGWTFTRHSTENSTAKFLAVQKDGVTEVLDMSALDHSKVRVLNRIRYISTSFDPTVFKFEHEEDVTSDQYLICHNNSAETPCRDHGELAKKLLQNRIEWIDEGAVPALHHRDYLKELATVQLNPIIDERMVVRKQKCLGKMPRILTGKSNCNVAAICAVGDEMVELRETVSLMLAKYQVAINKR